MRILTLLNITSNRIFKILAWVNIIAARGNCQIMNQCLKDVGIAIIVSTLSFALRGSSLQI